MIYLIAESKSMSGSLRPVSEEDYISHRPTGEEQADTIMAHLSSFSIPELQALLKFSPRLAASAINLIGSFADKSQGLPVIDSFDGVVFKALDYHSLPRKAKDFAASRLFIVSSLYGMISPDDIIRPYRLDFDLHCAPGGKTLAAFWRKFNTLRLGRILRESPGETVINLLPGAASKCFDWKLLKALAAVRPVDFRTPAGPYTLATPSATRLKQMRGLFLREALCHRIDSLQELIEFPFSDFISEHSPMDGRLLYLSDL